MEQHDKILTANGMTKRFGGLIAVDELDLWPSSIHQREIKGDEPPDIASDTASVAS